MIEMLWDEQPSTGRGKNLTSGKAGSSFLEMLRCSSQPVHIWVMATQMHMFFHARVNITETDTHILVILNMAHNADTTEPTTCTHIHTQKYTHTPTLRDVGLKKKKSLSHIMFFRHDFMSAHFYPADQGNRDFPLNNQTNSCKLYTLCTQKHILETYHNKDWMGPQEIGLITYTPLSNTKYLSKS